MSGVYLNLLRKWPNSRLALKTWRLSLRQWNSLQRSKPSLLSKWPQNHISTKHAYQSCLSFHTSVVPSQIVKQWRPVSKLSPHINGSSNLIWTKIAFSLSAVASIAIGYLGYHCYSVYTEDDLEVDAHHVFFPLWFSMDWPTQRTYPFPEHLKYVDKDYYETILRKPEFLKELVKEGVPCQILNCLFRLNLIRNKYGIPLALQFEENNSHSIWIEPKYPTFHGLDIGVGKHDGHVQFLIDWQIKSIDWFGEIDGMIADIESHLDPMVREESSGVAGDTRPIDVVPVPKACSSCKGTKRCGDRDYNIVLRGSFQLYDKSGNSLGSILYSGVIDFAHLGINGGFCVTSLHLKTVEEGEIILYKVS